MLLNCGDHSQQFLDCITKIAESSSGDVSAASLAFRSYFRIACGCSSILFKWEELCSHLFTSKPIVSAFFEILKEPFLELRKIIVHWN